MKPARPGITGKVSGIWRPPPARRRRLTYGDSPLALEICECGHGAGWHDLAWIAWRNGTQTDTGCTWPDLPEDEYAVSCPCTQFRLRDTQHIIDEDPLP